VSEARIKGRTPCSRRHWAERRASIAISGTQTINGNDGTPDGKGNVVFNVTSYSESDGDVAAITAPTGALAGGSVVPNFGSF
jgi:hypothetical protein